MKKIILFCLIFYTVNCAAQSLFEIKFTGPDLKTKYSCLLVYYNEKDSYVRIRYTNPFNQERIVEVHYKGRNGKSTKTGKTYFELTATSSRFVSIKSPNESYNPDYFVWFGTEPLPYTSDKKPDIYGERDVYRVDSYRKVEITELTSAYLKTFYFENEKDYSSLLRMAIDNYKPKFDFSNADVATLHLVMLVNTDISDIGPGCTVDMRHLAVEFEGIASTLNVRYDLRIDSGTSFSKAAFRRTVNSLVVKPNDMVFFVYRGHGFRYENQASVYPMLALTRSQGIPLTDANTISLESVYSYITAKGGRLKVVLADCCNSVPEARQETRDNFVYMQSTATAQQQKLNDLFMKRKGDLLFVASNRGEVSWTNPSIGGFFTSSFLQAVSEEISYLKKTESSWANIINNTRNFALYKCSICSNCTTKQNAIAFNKITKMY